MIRNLKALLVVDEALFPSKNGSGAVYRIWFDALKEYFPHVSLLIFSRSDSVGGNELELLEKYVDSYFVIQAENNNYIYKMLRSLSRSMNRGLFASRWIESLGRSNDLVRAKKFVSSISPDYVFIQKLSNFVLGENVFEGIPSNPFFVLDIHDDFVEREFLERYVLKKLLTDYPELRSNKNLYRWSQRHKITLFSPNSARVQEEAILKKMNSIFISNSREYFSYIKRYESKIKARFYNANWVNLNNSVDIKGGEGSYHAGIIASDAPFNLEGVLNFQKNIYPLIIKKIPDFKILIAGSVAGAILESGLSINGIDYVKWIESTFEFYRSIDMSLIPLLHGTGMSVKAIESITYGVSLVSTPVGIRGLEFLPMKLGLDVADSDELFAECIIKKIKNRDAQSTYAKKLKEELIYNSRVNGLYSCVKNVVEINSFK